MPGIVTHHHFGRVVYGGLNTIVQNNINNLALYDFATSGPNAFLFKEFWKKDVRIDNAKISELFHTNKTKDFFIELVKQCKMNRNLFGYLAGFITHYYLDVFTNPYIYYRSGVYDIEKNGSIKYRGLHMKMERLMDCYIIDNYYTGKPKNFRIKKKVLSIKKLNKTYKESFDRLFNNVYGIADGYKWINKCIFGEKLFYTLTYDPIGIKTAILNKVDDGKSIIDFNQLTYYKKVLDMKKYDIFNFKHSKWCNPTNENITSIDSFFDLFEKAKIASIKCINEMFRYVYLDEPVNFDYYFNDLSYVTGLKCEKGSKLQYFNTIF